MTDDSADVLADFEVDDEADVDAALEVFDALQEDDDAVAALIRMYDRGNKDDWQGLSWWERHFSRRPNRVPVQRSEQLAVFFALNPKHKPPPRFFRPEAFAGQWYGADGSTWTLDPDGSVDGGPNPPPGGTRWRLHQAPGTHVDLLYFGEFLPPDRRLAVRLEDDDAVLVFRPKNEPEQRWTREPPEDDA
jgi:hypothetical protein